MKPFPDKEKAEIFHGMINGSHAFGDGGLKSMEVLRRLGLDQSGPVGWAAALLKFCKNLSLFLDGTFFNRSTAERMLEIVEVMKAFHPQMAVRWNVEYGEVERHHATVMTAILNNNYVVIYNSPKGYEMNIITDEGNVIGVLPADVSNYWHRLHDLLPTRGYKSTSGHPQLSNQYRPGEALLPEVKIPAETMVDEEPTDASFNPVKIQVPTILVQRYQRVVDYITMHLKDVQSADTVIANPDILAFFAEGEMDLVDLQERLLLALKAMSSYNGMEADREQFRTVMKVFCEVLIETEKKCREQTNKFVAVCK